MPIKWIQRDALWDLKAQAAGKDVEYPVKRKNKYLTRDELSWTLGCLELLSRLGFTPFHVNIKQEAVEFERKWWKRLVFLFFQILGLLNLVLYAVTWIVSMLVPKYFDLFYFPLHTVFVLGLPLTSVIQYTLFVLYPGVTRRIILELLSHLGKGENVKRGWQSYSIQEISLILLPGVYGTIIPGALLFILGPSRIFSVHILVPETRQTMLTYTLCTTVDMFLWALALNGAFLLMFFVLLFLETIQTSLAIQSELMSHPPKVTMGLIKGAVKKCGYHQVMLTLFNHNFANSIFLAKIFGIGSSIQLLHMVHLIHPTSPTLAAACLAVAFPTFFFYVLLFDQAFSIPGNIRRLKDSIVMASMKFPLNAQTTKRIVRSITNGGIKVGSFHIFERVSTPNYVNFIIQQLMSVIIASDSTRGVRR